MKLIKLIVWIILVFLTGCRKTEPAMTHPGVKEEIKFGEMRTRSQGFCNADSGNYSSDSGNSNSVVLSGFSFSLSASLDSDIPKTDYLWNIQVADKDGVWTSAKPVYWMDGIPITFFAIAPYSENQDIIQLSKAGELTSLTYIPPENAEGHLDIMTSTCTKSSGTVEFIFEHILTQLRFVVGKTFQSGVKINEIRLRNISGKGEYALHSHSWTIAPQCGQYTISDIGFTMDDSKSAGDLISATCFYLPPQVITNQDASIEIAAEDDGVEFTGTVALTNSHWDAGTIKTYSISYDGKRFSASMLEDLKDSVQVDIDELNEIPSNQ